VLNTIQGAGRPTALALAGSTVWVGYFDGRQNHQHPSLAGTLQRYSIEDGSLVASYGTQSVIDMAVGSDAVWVSDFGANEITGYRISDGSRIGSFLVRSGTENVYGIVYANGYLWVANPDYGGSNFVTKIWVN
jgi:hypothetical protein